MDGPTLSPWFWRPRALKPHLVQRSGIWFCRSARTSGMGLTVASAFADWSENAYLTHLFMAASAPGETLHTRRLNRA